MIETEGYSVTMDQVLEFSRESFGRLLGVLEPQVILGTRSSLIFICKYLGIGSNRALPKHEFRHWRRQPSTGAGEAGHVPEDSTAGKYPKVKHAMIHDYEQVSFLGHHAGHEYVDE